MRVPSGEMRASRGAGKAAYSAGGSAGAAQLLGFLDQCRGASPALPGSPSWARAEGGRAWRSQEGRLGHVGWEM